MILFAQLRFSFIKAGFLIWYTAPPTNLHKSHSDKPPQAHLNSQGRQRRGKQREHTSREKDVPSAEFDEKPVEGKCGKRGAGAHCPKQQGFVSG